ncbi:MAG TPA: ABC transporter substrate-binding protein, partial [Streptosporangiaceae bacterium]|nr:ABC transporter substrate-binding protein [Streptosporangiaceae bacterium]
MEIRLLGAIEVCADGILLPLGGPRQRAVLADLALHAGQAVPTSQLIDDLWGQRPPASAKSTLESYISRLRHVLNASGAAGAQLVTRPGGYLLDAAAPCVDVGQFRDLAARGSAAAERGDAAAAVGLLSSALALWRGPALADVRDAPFAVLAGQRLEDERLATIENLVEARLALGQHRELLPELEALIAGFPFRERFHAQLMLALYRSGRQADALAAFSRVRETLTSELGVEPGRELRELQRAVLRQARELEPPGAGAAGQAARPAAVVRAAARAPDREPGIAADTPVRKAAPPRRGRAWRWAAAATALGLAAAVALPLLLTRRPVHGNMLADGVGELTTAGSVARSLALPDPPGDAVAADGSVWVTSPEGDVVYRIDPATASLVQTVPVGSGPSAITASGPDIWVANTLDGTVSRISAAADKVVQTVPVGTEPAGITSGGGAIWVTDAAASTLSVLSPVSGKLTSTIPLSAAPFGVAFGAGAVWVTSPAGNDVTRVDPRSGQPGQQIPTGAGPTAITFGLGSVWVANSLDSTVSRIDPAADAVSATIPVGDGPDALAITGGSVWAADRLASAVTRINARSGSPSPPITVGAGPVALAAADRGAVWVAARPAAMSRPAGGMLRVASVSPPTSIDPALIYPWMPTPFSDAAYDTLVTFEKTGGSSGLRLVPDLALTMPTVTAGGTAYTFTLRPGLRYSTGRPVRPQDFRYALERVLDLNPAAASFLEGIAGTSACVPGKLCDLARGVLVNDSARTVTFRLSAPDPDFLDKLAFEFTTPVPANIPARDAGREAVPSTGPYMITRYIPGRQVVFARNRYFREWSAAAQPAGSPDRMVWTFGVSTTQETAQIEAGRADWTNDPLPGAAGLSARFPSQVHIRPLPDIVFTAFNTRVAPFNDPRVRRAFSLAADRSRLVAALGGPALATPTCQILPPGIPGHRPYCPFTADPEPAGAWIGPDLATARRLVAASGTRGTRITVWSDNAPPDGATAAFTVSVLRELGYRTALHIATHQALIRVVNDSRRHIQATDGNWLADYPSASDFLDEFFRCSAFHLSDPAATRNGTFYCNPAVDHMMNLADSQQATDPARAAATWAAADRAVTRDAPWVPLVNPNNVDFLSARVTNYQYNPFLGI